MRALYRVRQFWLALHARITAQDMELAGSILKPAQLALFTRLQVSEQAHALGVLRRLQAQGQQPLDLLVAALLHDVGKVRCRLFPWERALYVLARRLAARLAERLGQAASSGEASPAGWRRAFVVAEQHPAWGADLARQTGVSPLAEALIRHHQLPPASMPVGLETELLRRLRAADDES